MRISDWSSDVCSSDLPYPQSPSGMTGVQTLVPIMLTHVAEGRLSLGRFVDLTSAGPARIYGIAGKGRIARGFDADFTVVDLAARRTITDRSEEHTTELQSIMRIAYAVCGWKKKKNKKKKQCISTSAIIYRN